MAQHTFHCHDCDWSSAIAPALTRSEVTKQAISHHTETGHEITSTEQQGVSPAENRFNRTHDAAQSPAHLDD